MSIIISTCAIVLGAPIALLAGDTITFVCVIALGLLVGLCDA